jgi:hypothetical protein
LRHRGGGAARRGKRFVGSGIGCWVLGNLDGISGDGLEK